MTDERRWVKSNAEVDFPIYGLKPPNSRNMDVHYDLIAVCNHEGTMGGGHYTCKAKHENGNWYIFDDHKCDIIDENSIVVCF